MANNDRLFSHSPSAAKARSAERRRLMRGDRAQRHTRLDWTDDARATDDWDTYVETTVTCRGKLGAE